MHIIEKRLKKAEESYENKKSGKNALALFACYVLAHRTIDSEGIYLSKAYHVAVTAHQEDLLDIYIISALLNANVLLENYESANEIIRQLEVHSSFFSKNYPLFYGQILYFNSIVQANTEKSRSAKKIQRNLEILYERTELTQLLAYLGSIQKRVFGEPALCAKMYYEAMQKGLRSVYFLLDVYFLLTEEESYTSEMNEMARKVIPWALNNGLSVDAIIGRLEKKTLIGVLFSLNVRHLSKVYELTGHPGAFQCLCQKLIFEADVSEPALGHYMSALANHLSLRGLERISIRAAYKNNYRDLPMPLVLAALENPVDYGVGELAFLFGILLSADEAADGHLVEDAVKFGMWALSKGLKGRGFNLIYKFLYNMYPDDERLAGLIFEELFKYEVEIAWGSAKNVCAYGYAKRGVSVYPVDGSVAYVNSITDDFYCYFLGEGPGEYLYGVDYKASRSLAADETERIGLYEALYGRGFKSTDLIIAMAVSYMCKKELSKDSIDILQMATNLDEISEGLKRDIYARLAGHYSSIKQYSLAIHYYRLIGRDGMKPEDAPGALKTFIATGYHGFAVSLISAWRDALSDAEVFDSLKTLYTYSESPEIASMCYNLILNGMYGPEVLSILLKGYRGTSGEWLTIANKIDSLGFDVSQLYERIIVNGIFTGNAGEDCNEAFIKLYRINRNHSIIPKYVYFCCREIIKNGVDISDNLADILGEIYARDDSDEILCYALAIVCIRNGRQDKAALISEAALLQEEAGVLFPEFKQYQDKSFISSYIEKNTPFVYSRTAHMTVYLCYKTDEMTQYLKKRMNYFRFGMYLTVLPLFYGEKITYYFEEEGGAKTGQERCVKTHMRLIEQFSDPFYTINNAVIYEHMMKYDMVEELIEERLSANEQFPIITL